jgi:hypothetical protein
MKVHGARVSPTPLLLLLLLLLLPGDVDSIRV